MKHSKISYIALMLLIKYYLADISPKKAHMILYFKGIDITIKSIHVYYKKFMMILNIYVKDEMRNIMLEGPVEIDECMIYKIKRGINRRGRLGRIRTWLFGLKCRTSSRIILYPVLERTRTKLLQIILRHVRREALIYSHHFVNHDYQFVS